MKRMSMTLLAGAALALGGMAVEPLRADPPRSHVYHGKKQDYRYRYRCKRSKGTTGTIAGGAGGAIAGNALGGGVLGTVAGGVGGAVLGRHLDKKHDEAQNRKNGC